MSIDCENSLPGPQKSVTEWSSRWDRNSPRAVVLFPAASFLAGVVPSMNPHNGFRCGMPAGEEVRKPAVAKTAPVCPPHVILCVDPRLSGPNGTDTRGRATVCCRM